jgi:filamentous hemagglutinin
MSPQQAQAIAAMTPEQAGQVLGLPAAQAANILRNGMDFYAITPKAGVTPNVFVSNVASTTQGAVTMPGGAQQVIVPNRSLWTTPAPVNPFTLRPTGGQ